MDYSEKLVSRQPVIVRRRVRFGECDPAGVVYTPVFSEYAVSAYQWLMTALLGGPMMQEMRRLGIDMPMKAQTFEFRNALWPEQVFDMTCRIAEIRTRTFDIDVIATSTGENVHDIFVAKLTPIILTSAERRSIPIPDRLRMILEDYRSAGAAGAS